MHTTLTHADTRGLYSKDGKKWQDDSAITWEADLTVCKIVIGTPIKSGDDPETVSLDTDIPEDLATLYPSLTHLHLWQIDNLTTLPELPRTLKCLDVRGCPNFGELKNLPTDLDTLVLEALGDGFRAFPAIEEALASLEDLSLRACSRLSEGAIHRLLQQSPGLRHLNLSGTGITEISETWAESLVDIRLNDCSKLRRLPRQWPKRLRRIEFRNATAITSLSAFPLETDYVDLAYTSSLRQFPTLPETTTEATGPRRPRTLILFETGVPLERDLKGESDTTNVAARVLADLQASEEGRKADCELKDPWLEAVKEIGFLRNFAKLMMNYRFAKIILLPKSEGDVEKIANEISELMVQLLNDETTLIDLAAQRLERGRTEDAMIMLLHALNRRRD